MTARRMTLLLVLFSAGAGVARAETIGCFISSGDNDWLWTSPPVNSRAAIEATFESLHRVFQVNRIYWRGTHAEWLLDNMAVRPENFQGAAFWEWERHLVKEIGQNDLAIRAARKLGMEIWGVNPLFDFGAAARSDSMKVGTPSPVELRLRIEHPEYIPTDRQGLRRQSGPVEFAYPAVRRALVKQTTDLLTRRDFDGLLFYTYVEHCSTRFEDEFGYNQPIVDEFRRRFGRDIRHEDFDKHAWARLRGEFVTQYLRELAAALHARGKKLGVALDPQDTHHPAPWLCMRERGFHPAGRIWLDWERWVREGVVDEIVVWCNGDLEKGINEVLAVTRGTTCSVAAFHSTPWPPRNQHFARAGVRRIMAGSYNYIEWGWRDKHPITALDDADFLKRLSALHHAVEEKTALPLEKLTALVSDPDVLVRRQALLALKSRVDANGVSAIENALDDSETSVRCVAADVLCKLNAPGTVERLFRALRDRAEFQFQNAVVSTLANLPVKWTPQILRGCADANPAVRRVTFAALTRGVRRDAAVPTLVQAMDDSDAEVRFNAARALKRFPYRPEAGDSLVAHLSDPHPSVRCMAALGVSTCFKSHSRWISARQKTAVSALGQSFRRVSESRYRGVDRPWAFRPVGAALLDLGPRGREVLEGLMAQRKDHRLADFAWRVLYVHQTGWKYSLCAEKEAIAGYRRHPEVSGWKPMPRSAPPEPARVPYLARNFDSLPAYVRGKAGDILGDGGQWRTLGDTPPAPVIQSGIRRGNRGGALRLTRGPAGARHTIEGLRADYRLSHEQAEIVFWVYRPKERSSAAMLWRDSASGHWYVGVFLATGGRVSVVTGDRTWTKTKAVVPAKRWERVRIRVNGAKPSYSVAVGDGEPRQVRTDIPLPADLKFNMFYATPQGAEGTATYLDDISVTVPNPFR